MMTAGYPGEQGGGTAPPTAAGAAGVAAGTAPTPQPGPTPSAPHPPAQPPHDQCLGAQPLPPDHHGYHDQAQFEADKRAVYKHPLFPLLALLFEKCELATQSAESVSSDSFNLDIQAFVQHQERDRKPFLMNDPEVDGLMIKAIQVLRIHLLELEKVQELCKDFCNRYITCLKGKMQSENLLRTEYGYDSPGSPDGGSPYNGHHQHHMVHPHPQVVSTSGEVLGAPLQQPPSRLQASQHINSNNNNNNDVNTNTSNTNTTSAQHHLQQRRQQQQQQQQQLLLLQQSQQLQQLSSPCQQQQLREQQQQQEATPGTLVTTTTTTTISTTTTTTPTGHVTPTPPLTTPTTPASPPLIHGSTPLSQIGANPCPPPPDGGILNLLAPLTPPSCEEEEDGGLRRQKRGVLPKHATAVMKAWLFQHIVHPYPSEDEKRQIAAQTHLTLLQVNNWFINARRRILQPMIDASTPPEQKTKKSKNYNPKASATRGYSQSCITRRRRRAGR
ncbi:homeobox protein PKNOX1-like [Oratosquilla oratoria]|uniref:homeobox protein PKNOX1-like n=1 Tax=Oratosquilla oratoria TaxID=337810 RepID=UPI003F75E861